MSAFGAAGGGTDTRGPVTSPGLAMAVPLPRSRRGAELIMLAFAIGVVLFAYASVGLGLNGHVPTGLATYGLLFAVLMLAAHLAIRKLAPWADPLLLPLAALLNGLGLVMIYRLQEAGRNGNPGTPISTMSASTTTFQLMWSTIGVIAFVAVLVVVREPRMLQRLSLIHI